MAKKDDLKQVDEILYPKPQPIDEFILLERRANSKVPYPTLLAEAFRVSEDLELFVSNLGMDTVELITLLMKHDVLQLPEEEFYDLVAAYHSTISDQQKLIALNRALQSATTNYARLKHVQYDLSQGKPESIHNLAIFNLLDQQKVAAENAEKKLLEEEKALKKKEERRLSDEADELLRIKHAADLAAKAEARRLEIEREKAKYAPHVKLIEDIDIYRYPPRLNELDTHSGSQITIGDLHGNAIKLIHFLMMHNVMRVNQDDYARLVQIYQKPVTALMREDLEQFEKIINNAKFNKINLVRLIGDELADRGSNDYFTLLMFDTLKKKNIPLEIELSNHGQAFLDAFENNFKIDPHSKLSLSSKDFPPRVGETASDASLQNLITLIDKGLVGRDKVTQLVDEAYKPVLKPISYSYNQVTNKIKIYSHAPIDLNTIQALAKVYDIPFKIGTLKNLIATIDKINDHVHTDIMNGSLLHHPDFNYDTISDNYMSLGRAFIQDAHPLLAVAWRRNDRKLLTALEAPKGANYSIEAFIHGHEGPLHAKKNNPNEGDDSNFVSHQNGMINLDTLSGRDDLYNKPNPKERIDKKRPFMTMMMASHRAKKNELTAISFKQKVKMYDTAQILKGVRRINDKILQSTLAGKDITALANRKREMLYILIGKCYQVNTIDAVNDALVAMQRLGTQLESALKCYDVIGATSALLAMSNYIEKNKFKGSSVDALYAMADFQIKDPEFYATFVQFLQEKGATFAGTPFAKTVQIITGLHPIPETYSTAKDGPSQAIIAEQRDDYANFLMQVSLQTFPVKADSIQKDFQLMMSAGDAAVMASYTDKFILNKPYVAMDIQMEQSISQMDEYQSELQARLYNVPDSYFKLDVEKDSLYSPDARKALLTSVKERFLNEVQSGTVKIPNLNLNTIRYDVEQRVARQAIIATKNMIEQMVEDKKFKFVLRGEKIKFKNADGTEIIKKVPKKIAKIYNKYCIPATNPETDTQVNYMSLLRGMLSFGKKTHQQFSLFRRKDSKKVFKQLSTMHDNEQLAQKYRNDVKFGASKAS